MRLWTWLLVAAALIVPVSANAEGANYIKRGFSFPTDHRARILVLYPDWFIGSLTSKGEGSVNPEWETLMFTNVRAALTGGPVGGVADLRFMMPEQAAASPVLEEVRKAFIPLTGELIFRVPQGSSPVQKGKKGYYDYSIGADLAARVARRMARPSSRWSF